MTRAFDLAIVAAYLAFMAGLGVWFSRRQTSTENYFVAKRSVPSWAMGMSMLATMVSSVTFVAYPGSSYAKDWSLLVPGFLLLALLPVIGRIIIPFYREEVGMSAYEYFQRRFGRPARVYAAIAFSLAHFSKMGFVLYLMALTIASMTGWDIVTVIFAVAVVMVFYTVIGGIEAVVWSDVVQGFVMWAGIAVALGYLLFLPPGGPGAVFAAAAHSGKFALGSPDFDFTRPTIPVAILYGLFWYGQRYVADQTMVQRYLLAKSDRGAMRGVAMGALLCVPVWAFFMLIGTCVWSFFRLTGEAIPKTIQKADQMFPYFLSAHLPPGVMGLLLAALTGAAMTMLASDLNTLSMVLVEDFYRAARPAATDKQRLKVARLLVVVVGLLNVVTAVILVQTKGSALSMWFAVSAIASGGLAGLFFLAFLSRRATRRSAWVGIVCSSVFTVWAVLTKGAAPLVNLAPFNYPGDDLTIGAVGNVILFVAGLAASLLEQPTLAGDQGTVWHWLASRQATVEKGSHA
ncbi:sodium:solute symporter [Paludibaculum fermentans]|uniref:Sodium:solute symporter n=1 Tax=Paludibaculum fermentans TaxID=1473598 RepID=A0A7S7NK96_PALFE|nr:sodium:solute symporter [Paludibaculum fermentans]QOY85188.1 sodium:solute symporter [Paludibaculum fermentans]